MKRVVSFVVAFLPVAIGARAEVPLVAAPGWAEVSVIFAKRCTMCHSGRDAARGLRLDSYEAAVAGGEKGAVLLAGDADHSELVRRLRGESAPRMPFLSRPLPPEQIDLIIRWIEAGLPATD